MKENNKNSNYDTISSFVSLSISSKLWSNISPNSKDKYLSASKMMKEKRQLKNIFIENFNFTQFGSLYNQYYDKANDRNFIRYNSELFLEIHLRFIALILWEKIYSFRLNGFHEIDNINDACVVIKTAALKLNHFLFVEEMIDSRFLIGISEELRLESETKKAHNIYCFLDSVFEDWLHLNKFRKSPNRLSDNDESVKQAKRIKQYHRDELSFPKSCKKVYNEDYGKKKNPPTSIESFIKTQRQIFIQRGYEIKKSKSGRPKNKK